MAQPFLTNGRGYSTVYLTTGCSGFYSGMTLTHVYNLPGSYTVVVTATNCGTATAVLSRTLAVASPMWRIYLPLVIRRWSL